MGLGLGLERWVWGWGGVGGGGGGKRSGLSERARDSKERDLAVVVAGRNSKREKKKATQSLTDNPPGRAIELDGRADLEVVGGHGTGTDDEARRARSRGETLARRREDLLF